MNPTSSRDLVVGLFVLAGLAAIAYLSLSLGGLSYSGPGGMKLFVDFDEIGGLSTRAPVVISGVKVGQVSAIDLGDDYRAHVTLDVDKSLELPTDTSASIVTSGVLGDRYISLQLGGEEDFLHDGDELTFAESAVILERLIGQFIHNTNVEKDEE